MGPEGVLCHLTSLPESGLEEAQRFLDWLNEFGDLNCGGIEL